jgi:hypothetical protein
MGHLPRSDPLAGPSTSDRRRGRFCFPSPWSVAFRRATMMRSRPTEPSGRQGARPGWVGASLTTRPVNSAWRSYHHNPASRGGRLASAGRGINAIRSQEPIRSPPHARGWRLSWRFATGTEMGHGRRVTYLAISPPKLAWVAFGSEIPQTPSLKGCGSQFRSRIEQASSCDGRRPCACRTPSNPVRVDRFMPWSRTTPESLLSS